MSETVKIIDHEEVVSSSGEKKKFYTWENSIGDACGGFETYEEALKSATCFHSGKIEIVQ